MKLTKLFAILSVLALALFAGKTSLTPSAITVTCSDATGGTGGTVSCPAAGETNFSGMDYPRTVFVVVTRDDGTVYDMTTYDQDASGNLGGPMGINETLSPAATYTFDVYLRKNEHQLLQSVTVVTQ